VRIRLRLLGALHHLATTLSLETLYSADRSEFTGLSPDQQMVMSQWRYVRSVDIIDRQLLLHFHVPLGRAASYLQLIVTPLRQEIESLLRQYEDILHTDGIYLRFRNEPAPREDTVDPLTEEEQTALRHWIEVRLARADEQQSQENRLRRQRLHDRLSQANIQAANDHEQRGEREQAANLLVQTVRSLHDEREAFQLARYAYRAGQLYKDIDQSHAAVRCYLMVADAYFNDTLTPELGHEALSRAEAVLQTTPDPVLEIQLALAAARIHFVALSDDLSIEAVSQARTALTAVTDSSIQLELSVEIALLDARLALVREEWQQALACLEQALCTCPPEAKKKRFALLSFLLTVMTQCNDERADDVYQEACGCLSGEESQHQQGLLSMYYAGSLACRGQLDRAYRTYHDTITMLDDVGSLYEMFVLYQNMAHMLLKHSGTFFPGHDRFDNLRIDLFHRTKSLNRGNRHEEKANESIVQEKHRDFMRHIRLASYHFWSDTAWFGLQSVNELFARHYTAVDEPHVALFYAIEANDTKLVDKLAGTLAKRAEPDVLLELIPKLINISVTSSSQDLIALSLGTLADVVSPTLL
jgi:tetratricopeptide (TPR) repeat protein